MIKYEFNEYVLCTNNMYVWMNTVIVYGYSDYVRIQWVYMNTIIMNEKYYYVNIRLVYITTRKYYTT